MYEVWMEVQLKVVWDQQAAEKKSKSYFWI